MCPWRRGNFNQRRRATARSWERPTRSSQVSHHWALCMCTMFRKRTDHFCLCRIHRVSPLLVSRLPILSSQCWTSLFFLLQPLPWQVFLQLTVTARQPGPSVLRTHTAHLGSWPSEALFTVKLQPYWPYVDKDTVSVTVMLSVNV